MMNQSNQEPETALIAGVEVLTDGMVVNSHDSHFGPVSCDVVARPAADPETVVLLHVDGLPEPHPGCRGIAVSYESLTQDPMLDNGVLVGLLETVKEAAPEFKDFPQAARELDSLHDALGELADTTPDPESVDPQGPLDYDDA